MQFRIQPQLYSRSVASDVSAGLPVEIPPCHLITASARSTCSIQREFGANVSRSYCTRCTFLLSFALSIGRGSLAHSPHLAMGVDVCGGRLAFSLILFAIQLLTYHDIVFSSLILSLDI